MLRVSATEPGQTSRRFRGRLALAGRQLWLALLCGSVFGGLRRTQAGSWSGAAGRASAEWRGRLAPGSALPTDDTSTEICSGAPRAARARGPRGCRGGFGPCRARCTQLPAPGTPISSSTALQQRRGSQLSGVYVRPVVKVPSTLPRRVILRVADRCPGAISGPSVSCAVQLIRAKPDAGVA